MKNRTQDTPEIRCVNLDIKNVIAQFNGGKLICFFKSQTFRKDTLTLRCPADDRRSLSGSRTLNRTKRSGVHSIVKSIILPFYVKVQQYDRALFILILRCCKNKDHKPVPA